MDYAVESIRNRELAEYYRTMAKFTSEEGLRAHYKIITEGYDRLAEYEARIARNLRDLH